MNTIAYGLPRHNGHAPEALVPAVTHGAAAPALGEAPSTMNCYVDLPGYGKTQVTGRGRNGAEAARNLKDGVDALRAVCAPPVAVPQTREAQVAQLLSCGLTRAVAKGDFQRVERLAKAAALVLSGAVHPAGMEGKFTVDSRTQVGIWYDVNSTGECGCKDYKHHATEDAPWYCLHSLAVMMVLRLTDTAGA